MKLSIWTFAAATCALATVASFAETPTTPANRAVEGRQAYMRVLAFNMDVLGGMARGETEYSPELASALSEDLVKLTDLTQAGFWPRGTSIDDVANSRTLPVAWTDFAATQGYIAEIDDAMAKLAADAGTLEGLQARIRAAEQSCRSCHQAMLASQD